MLTRDQTGRLMMCCAVNCTASSLITDQTPKNMHKKKLGAYENCIVPNLPFRTSMCLFSSGTDQNIGRHTENRNQLEPAARRTMQELSRSDSEAIRLDMGYIAFRGDFHRSDVNFDITENSKPAMALLFRLIAMLQFRGTGPSIDIDAHTEWFTEEKNRRR